MNENQGILRYREFLVARDGEADLLRHSLSKREAFFDDLARSPVRSSAQINRACYFRNMARRRTEPAVVERFQLLYNEILADEIDHVGFIAARLDEHGRAMMRRLYARVSYIGVTVLRDRDVARILGDRETLSAFHLADAAAELPTLGFAAAQI